MKYTKWAESQEDDPTHAQTEADRDSDASDLAEISAPMIDFYVQDMPNHLRKLVSPDPPKIHVRALDDPRVPACARLRNQGIRIADMMWLGSFPAAAASVEVVLEAPILSSTRVRPISVEQGLPRLFVPLLGGEVRVGGGCDSLLSINGKVILYTACLYLVMQVPLPGIFPRDRTPL